MTSTSYLVLMLIWLAFDALRCVVLLARETVATSLRDVGRVLHITVVATLLGLTLVQLGGCGGGDWPDDDRKVPPPGVDCQARPELCA